MANPLTCNVIQKGSTITIQISLFLPYFKAESKIFSIVFTLLEGARVYCKNKKKRLSLTPESASFDRFVSVAQSPTSEPAAYKE